MKISGTSVLHATPDKVWAAITDPAVLAGVIPGCQVLNPLGDNHFGLTVHMGVAAIKGTYAGEVKLYDLIAPSSLTMRAAGAGAPGTIDTTVAVTLSDAGDGTTRLDYDADAAVGGMVGGVGQRVLTSVAKKTAGLFFASIDDVLTGKRAVTGQPASAAVPPAPGAAASGESPFGATLAAPAAAGPAGVGPAALVAAAVTGAVAMAAGVLIGARIARRR
ncbi:MAG TPA: carbon monoxide dehydrogenase subunit G [Nakamurella sp.]|nr:carbon monoxide dehydrogenase subunit G [Nakamurella sp.]